MSEHKAIIQWTRQTADFAYDTYNRSHHWDLKDGLTVPVSAAIDFKGDSKHCDPEEALVGALASCHMLTFLAIASKKQYVIDAYEDHAIGYLKTAENGGLAVTHIELRPKVTFSKDKLPSQSDLQALHDSAHKHCFIANSIKSEVSIIPVIE